MLWIGGMMLYKEFLRQKKVLFSGCGKTALPEDVHPLLFPFQRDLVAWAVRKGRAAIFADTGLGKTFMQLEWARLLGEKTIIIAPLSVARQTATEADKIGLEVPYVRSNQDIAQAGSEVNIFITNYEMIHAIDVEGFMAVVLDESSILKAIDGKTRQALTDAFIHTPYKLCCTATPAPNDIAEIANHSEFLGIRSRADMLATYFVHDDDGWRLKGHAHEQFYKWMSSWGMSVRLPSDLGYEDDGYILPPLTISPLFVDAEYQPEGALFFTGMKGIGDRIKVRRATTEARVEATAEIVNADTAQWIVWCGMNDEAQAVAKLIPGAVNVEGQDSTEFKETAIQDFKDGKYRVLVTKPKIAGYGLNLQNAHKMAFLGLSDSWEAYYQCIRRCYRFGQQNPVTVHIVLSTIEKPIYDNVMRKESEARSMSDNLIANVQKFEVEELRGAEDQFDYETAEVDTGEYRIMLGDSVERMAEIADESVDLSVFSPPFLSLYTYTPTERDIGNSRTEEEFYGHFGYIIAHLLRITKPGRNACCHVSQVPAMLVRDGYIGMKDFRGKTIEAFQAGGFIYHGEVVIDKDPQAQAIRTKSKSLMFTQLKKDASWLRPALADFILVFRKPGDNQVPVKTDLTNDEWIEYARPIWYGIKETETLNVAEGRDNADERHICPLQLGTIRRCIRLWSNPGEVICSPFTGIGSEGYEALKLGRRFVGVELKKSYFRAACRNLDRASSKTAKQSDLFSQVAGG